METISDRDDGHIITALSRHCVCSPHTSVQVALDNSDFQTVVLLSGKSHISLTAQFYVSSHLSVSTRLLPANLAESTALL